MDNTKCGFIVFLNAHIGQLIIDDVDLFLSDEAKDHLHSMGFDLSKLEVKICFVFCFFGPLFVFIIVVVTDSQFLFVFEFQIGTLP